MHELEVNKQVAVCKFIPRNKVSLRYAALFPQKELFSRGKKLQSAGFNLVFLPYAEDLKELDKVISERVKKLGSNDPDEVATDEEIDEEQEKYGDAAEPSEEEIQMAVDMINGMSMDYEPGSYQNPAL